MSLPLLTRRPTASTVALAIVGVVGSGLVARASYVVGALPHHYIDREAATGPYRWPYEIGVALLVLAWLGLGRLVLDHSVSGMTRRVSWAAGAMAAPLMVAAPVTSQDVWAYLGQANVAVHGLDPYSIGPASAPGPYAHAVAHDWLHTGSPYGPLWLWICRVIVDLTDPTPGPASSSSASSRSSASWPRASPSSASPEPRAHAPRWPCGSPWPGPSRS